MKNLLLIALLIAAPAANAEVLKTAETPKAKHNASKETPKSDAKTLSEIQPASGLVQEDTEPPKSTLQHEMMKNKFKHNKE